MFLLLIKQNNTQTQDFRQDTMNKSPAFQFYAADFMIGIMGMSDEEVGIYIKMLSTQWLHGSLPNCQKTIKKMINSRKFPSEIVMRKFAIGEDGFLRNERMENVREKQKSFAETRKDNANKRWEKEKSDNALAMHVHNKTPCINDALHLQSSSSSSTTSVLPKDNTPLPFDSSDFKSFWSSWEQHLSEKKKPLKPTTRKMQLAKLAEMGEQRAIAALKHSMTNGWQGIYEPDVRPNKISYGKTTYADRHPSDPEANQSFETFLIES
jgi:uncharacterized protein YdaU (DUF1376 family)